MQSVYNYLIVGSGRVARHFEHYFNLIGVNYRSWSRQKNTLLELKDLSKNATNILLLINDDAIADFSLFFEPNKTLIHFSPILEIKNVYSIHPLMTFSNMLYDLQTYKQFYFVIDEKTPPVTTLLPGLPNKWHRISYDLKSFYHAVCVLSCNFSSLLWQKAFKEFKNNFLLPQEAIIPYFKQVTENIKQDPFGSLTGPMVRGDYKTIDAHLDALEKDPYKTIYEAFLKTYQQEKNNK